MQKFSISCKIDDRDQAPPVSYKIREYFEHFVMNKIIQPRAVFFEKKGHSNLDLSIILVPDFTKREKPVNFSKFKYKVVPYGWFLKPESTKGMMILVSYKKINEARNPLRMYIKLLFDSIIVFFTELFSEINPWELELLRKEIDYDFLKSFPYPAPYEEQKYVWDK